MTSGSTLSAPAARWRRPSYAVALVVACSLVLAGCGGGKKTPASSDRPTSQPSQGGTQLAAVWPLTGLPAPATTPKHPVMIVKYDNTPASQPQSGLSKADLVTEELVEGGITRLAAFYYSTVPHLVGPVRSMRATDIGVAKPAHAVLVTSGGATPTVQRMAKAHVTWYGQGSTGFFRATNGQHDYLHSLFVHLDQLAATLKKKAIVPASFLPWGTEKDFTGGQPAKQIHAKFSSYRTTNWTYRNGTYDNTNSYAAAGDKFNPNTVLVLRVHITDAGYLDPAGHFVPETVYQGTGPAMLFHGGQVVRATWSKKKLNSAISLRTAAGPLKVPAGHVWIELVPLPNAGHGVSGNVTYTP